jgi:hypothetical protein
MKTTEHFSSPACCAFVAGFCHVSTSPAHTSSPLGESSSENGSTRKIPHNSHNRPDNDRISSDIVRIILRQKPTLTHVISEAYDFFYSTRLFENLGVAIAKIFLPSQWQSANISLLYSPLIAEASSMNPHRYLKYWTVAAVGMVSALASPTAPIIERAPIAPPQPPPILEAPADSTLAVEPLLRAAATIYSIGDPTPEEQLYVEMINRARANPVAEALLLATTTDPEVLSAYDFFNVDLALMQAQFAALAPAPPLALNAQLITAARRHTQDMFDNSFQGHTGTDNTQPSERVTQSGYAWQVVGENVYSNADSVFHGHAGFEVDWGFGPGGMQTPAGHRNSIHDARFREIGVGVILGENQPEPGSSIPGSREVGPQLVTQELATRQGATPLITGVVYFDLNGNNFYDLGEGIGGVNVSATGVSMQAVTARSGGYTLPVPGNGVYTVTFSGANIANFSQPVTVASAQNQKLDFRPTYTAPVLTGTTSPAINNPNSYSISPVPAASAYQWRSFRLLTPTVEGAESGTSTVTINQVGLYNVFEATTKKSGAYAFHLATPTGEEQSITLKKDFLVTSATTLRFQSRLGWAADDTYAIVEISTDDGLTWREVYRQAGTDNAGETTFNSRSANLSSFAGQIVKVRFVFRPTTTYYPQTTSNVGWFIDDILVDGGSEVSIDQTSGELTSPAFSFQPTFESDFVLQARARTGHSFLPWGQMLNVHSIPGTVTPPTLRVSSISIEAGHAYIEVDVVAGSVPASMTLQTKGNLSETWTTVSAAPEVVSPTRFRFDVLVRVVDPQKFYRVIVN